MACKMRKRQYIEYWVRLYYVHSGNIEQAHISNVNPYRMTVIQIMIGNTSYKLH